ncbi:tenascin-N-like [Xenopus laevis]|uniref:Tenascin-N-like n=1 Tax=Xenopus laevis TaxID=8355 RepID=A0A8J1N2Q9_XENLA|nr:tenascin-N-like [Xenopus laevis]
MSLEIIGLLGTTEKSFAPFSSGASDLQITNVTSPTSAQLVVTWTSTSSSISYFLLELRVVNNTAIALVSSIASAQSRSKLVQGLRAGTLYNVTLKSYTNTGAVRSTSVQAETVPATPVITSTNGISSSEISLTWNPQVGVDYYFVMVSMGSDSNNKTFAGTLNGTVDGLQPSTVYNLTLYAVNSAGPSAASRRVSVYTLTQAPGIVSVTPVSSSSVTLTWTRVDNALMYGIFVYEEGPINNLLYIMKTTTSTITLNNLQPCTKYILNVASYNWFYVIGGKAEVPYKYGNLDPPQGITIQYSSYMQSALISWVPSTAASIYVATATSDRGHVAICNTSTTSCEIQDLHCEQKYVVSVVAQTGTCYSNSSKESTVETAPCAPENITVTGDCQVNTIMLQWSPAIDAIQYTAYALTSDHQMLECRNVVPNCFFINLLCGTEYEMSVMATSAKINSSRSHGIKARTAPCDPGNVAAVPNCNSSVLDVSWGLSNGANTYIALAQGSSGHTYNCSSVSTGCQITGVQCGDSLSVTVIAYDNYCSSWSSSTDEIVTAPCTPTIITTETDCNSQSSSVQWMYSQGAILYMARAVSAIDNSEYFCQTSDLRCTLTDLPCGQMFTVSVKANNFQCDSASSQEVEIYSVPCIPNSVSSELDCTLNTVLVQWSPDSVNTTYTATIEEKGIGFHSCATQESYCVVRDLSCGQNYSVSVKADNGQCTSTSEWTAPSLTAPCKPTEIKANSICYNNSMQMTWSKNQAFGIDMYLVQMHSPDGQQRACQSTSEACITEAIECGTIYEATVTAVSVNCESKSSTIYTVPVPCSPKQLTDTVAPDFVVLTWNSVPGALNYTTEIAGGGIERHICTTINTSCSMTDLLCGHQYSMIVTAAGKQCNNVSDTHQFQTAPCVPQNVLASLDCTSNVVTVSWNSSLGANNYTTKAEGTDGQTYFCNSTSTFCDIAGLKCGHSYQVTVEAANEKSKSGPSIPVPIETAPCVPVADSPQLHCNNTVSLAWATTLGANNYVSNVTAPQGQPLSCATSDTGCIISSLQCGQVYNVTVTALNAKCSSPASPPSSFTTAPCTPQNVVTKLDCITNVATVSWDSSAGAELYTANVVGGNENLHSCNTTSLSCDIMGLTCGQMYTATVTAANEICKSKPSSEAQIQTAPCAPEQQPPQLNCETNTATLSWGQTLGAAQYVSNVTAPGEQPLSCATENNSCTISELKCGLIYNATVTAINNQCRGPESTTTTIITVPCQPQNLIAAMNCTSSITLLDWDESAGALGYTSILSAPGGEQRFCNSTTGHCEVRNLQCGQLYTVFVKAHNVQCDSTPSASAQLHSVPCVPSNVQTQINCELDSATLTWDATNGALSYSATVMGPQNEEYFCQTANLLCRFPTLSCGLEYNATILAVGDTCNSDASAPLPFQSVPCAATELNMQYECNKDTAELSWASTLGAIMYTASINTQDGTTLQCNTTGTSCVVTGIKCGQRYTMAVETFDTTCSSKAISPNQFLTAPCIPKNITSTINCQDNSALLSWSRAPGALNYSSLVTGPNGEHQTCQTDSTTCNISALTCGFTYNATVTAFNSQCKGENSEVVHIVTAPCAPENVIAVIDCTLSTVTLSWEEVVSGQSFTSYLNGPDNWIKTCSNTLPTCNITGLPCGLQFSATVSAANSHCVGPLSNPVEVISAPCMPVNVYTTVECTDNSVDIFWDRSNGSLNYTSSVLGAGGQQYHCSTEDLSCRVPKLHCGEVYSVIVFAENDICSSQPSHAIEFPSSPCTPINLVDQVFINLVVLSWGPTPGALNYTTQVAGVNGEKHVCSTSNTNCSLQGLLCGQHYNMSVTAIGPLCSNISDLHEFQTGPCTPLNVIAEIDCVSNTGLISWDSSPGAENYKAVANGTAEDIHTCNSTSTSCDFFGLKCGTTYSVVVIAANEKSNSKPSSPVELKTEFHLNLLCKKVV